MPIIYSCGCGDTDSFAKDAFHILFPDQPVSLITSQKPQNPEFEKWNRYLQALDSSKDKFAYYISETELWDLLKGVRVA